MAKTELNYKEEYYKHLGRTNTCSQEHRTAEDYREFFRKLKEDMEHDND